MPLTEPGVRLSIRTGLSIAVQVAHDVLCRAHMPVAWMRSPTGVAVDRGNERGYAELSSIEEDAELTAWRDVVSCPIGASRSTRHWRDPTLTACSRPVRIIARTVVTAIAWARANSRGVTISAAGAPAPAPIFLATRSAIMPASWSSTTSKLRPLTDHLPMRSSRQPARR